MQKSTCMLSIIIYFFSSTLFAQEGKEQIIADINDYRLEQNDFFSDPKTSPLEAKDLKTFEKLSYYPIDLKYRVKARFKKHPVMKLFYMKTTTDRLPKYGRYGELSFEIDGKLYSLQVYQNQSYMDPLEGEATLFIPFTDLSSGEESYGGGRYLDINIPNSDEVILDFNKSYNPYCAYNSKYSCPVPPRENDLNIEVLAGIKNFSEH